MSPVSQSIKNHFLEEWVTSIFYGGEWNDVEDGTLKENVKDVRGLMSTYIDKHTKEVVFITEKITGYRIKQREFRPVVVDSKE